MAYQSLYRRYRPQRFAEVRGQDHLVRALRNAVIEGRVGHAYLFSGPRGTGKTSTARILAKVLNCEAPVDGEPCGTCDSCVAIEHGSSFDVHELDAASNNGVEAIRDLINKAALGTPGRTKVYILDEVHMLSTAASNALLKTLEEPPEHVVFVLATTDPQKVLPTIKSRTQHFEVHLLPASDLEALVEDVIKDAGLDVSDEGRAYVLRAGAGSARDTLSALDQVVAAGGVPDEVSALDELVEALCDRDTGRALMAVDDAINSGRGPRVLGENLIARLRDVFLAAMKADLSRLSDEDRSLVTEQARRLGAAGATRALEVVGDAFVGIQDAPDPRIPLEVALVRLTKPEAEHSMSAIVERLERLERGLGPIGSAIPPAPHTPNHVHVDAAAGDDAAPEVAPAVATDEVDETTSDAVDLTDDATAATSPPASAPAAAATDTRPAAEARRQLAAKKGAKGTAPAARSMPKKAPTKSATKAAAGAPPASTGDPFPDTPAKTTKAAKPTPRPAASSSAAPGTLPSRDDLTLAWGDVILGGLPPKVKSRFASGRFVTVADGRAHFGLPNAMHARKCEEVSSQVEDALEKHFGTPVPLLIVIDDEPVLPSDAQGFASDPTEAPAEENEVDVTLLVDADDAASSSAERITEVFPGAEFVEEE